MTTKTKAFTAAGVGLVLGAGGLTFLAMPAGADEPPVLPPISAEELTQSMLTAKTPALDGTVKVDNNLGLPTLPGAGPLQIESGRVYNDGNGRSRLAAQQGTATEQTIVHDGATVWTYDSAKKTANKITVPAEVAREHGTKGQGMVSDPAAAATELVNKVRESSTVTVDGTARVAERAAYELVLTPKPTERTLLREVRVAVDSETRLPLRLSVMNNGSPDPALQIGFTQLRYAPQPADLFTFTPPPGTKVTEQQPQPDPKRAAELANTGKFVGDGWDTTYVGTVPAEALAPKQSKRGENIDPKALLEKVSKPISGPFGTGRVVNTKVGTALLADDGRFAIGAVPEQVLVEALSAK